MDWDDEFDSEYGCARHSSDSNAFSFEKQTGNGRDPMDISDPVGAYFFLSDDAQDEITETGKKRMKCRVCAHRFTGEIYLISQWFIELMI